MTLVMKKFTTRLSWKPKPNRKPRFFLQNLPKPTDQKHFETVTTLLRPTNGWALLPSLAHLSKFQRVSRLGFVTAPTSLNSSEPNFARCSAVSCTRILYMHFCDLLSPNGTLPAAKFTLRPSLVFSYTGSINACNSSSGHQPNFAAWYTEWNYATFAEVTTYIRLGGHHIGHWPTF